MDSGACIDKGEVITFGAKDSEAKMVAALTKAQWNDQESNQYDER